MTTVDAGQDGGWPLAVIDFEASCFPDRPGSIPIEVAVAYVETGAVRSWLIRPSRIWEKRGITWDPAAAKVHGIPRELLEREGLPVERVAAELRAAVAGHVVLSDATGSDGFWMAELCRAAAEVPPCLLVGMGDMLRAVLRDGRPDIAEEEMEAEVGAAWRRAAALHPVEHRAGPDAARWAEVLRILGGLA